MTGNRLFVVRVECTAEEAAVLEAACAADGEAPVCQLDAGGRRARLEWYGADAGVAEARRDWLRALLGDWAAEDTGRLSDLAKADEDWRESWKAHFHARRVSGRLVIKPSWEQWDPAPGECVIELDPGTSFGTGLHFTTCSCLQVLDRLAREGGLRRVCDLGCGSGILAVAAARLGVPAVTAVDNDPAAVACTQENARRNGVADRVRACTGSAGGTPGVAEPGYDLVLANILSPVLLEHAGAIAGRVVPGGALVLAGLTREEADTVSAAYVRIGCREIERLTDPVWATLLLRRDSSA